MSNYWLKDETYMISTEPGETWDFKQLVKDLDSSFVPNVIVIDYAAEIAYFQNRLDNAFKFPNKK